MRPRQPLLAATTLPMLLAGCVSYAGLNPQSQPRDPATLSASASLSTARLSDAAWPSERWWSVFGDPQLNALIDEALAGSPTLAAADARARKAQAAAHIADAVRQPTASVSAQVAGLQLPKTLAGDEIGGSFKLANVLMLSLSYSPDLWGQSRHRWQAAVGTAKAAEVDAQAARLQLAANIARTYMTLAQAYDLLECARADATRTHDALQLQMQRQRAGIDNSITLESKRAAAAVARQQVAAVIQHVDALRNALALLAGAAPDRAQAITPPHLSATPNHLAIPSALPSNLLAQRADIAAARWRVEAARHGIDASKAAFYPSLNLSALVGLAASSLGDVFGQDALLFNGGPALRLPIFHGSQLRGQLQASNADYDQAVAAYNHTLLAAIRDVVDAVQSSEALDAQLQNATQAHASAEKALALVEQRFHAGLANRLDVLAAQQPVLQVEQVLAGLNAQRRIAAVDLNQALGGGFHADAPPSIADQ